MPRLCRHGLWLWRRRWKIGLGLPFAAAFALRLLVRLHELPHCGLVTLEVLRLFKSSQFLLILLLHTLRLVLVDCLLLVTECFPALGDLLLQVSSLELGLRLLELLHLLPAIQVQGARRLFGHLHSCKVLVLCHGTRTTPPDLRHPFEELPALVALVKRLQLLLVFHLQICGLLIPDLSLLLCQGIPHFTKFGRIFHLFPLLLEEDALSLGGLGRHCLGPVRQWQQLHSILQLFDRLLLL
mmetsp:Transcript_96088/g.228841  ORF Transcript_96088/g.228841 Transcript_96088/m.228841 type:complete len:240 (+) Transcript_96088:1304-2023(+)